MPTPGRFRSKTSDLSEFIRGSSSKQSTESRLAAGAYQAPPPPPVPQTPDKAVPTKSRRKLAFLGRRRKSGSVSPSPSASSQKSGEHTGIPTSSQAVPPLPDLPSRQISDFTARSPERISTSLPPVLPPPNVSPSSFGSLSQFSHSRPNVLDVFQTPNPSRHSISQAGKTLRTQRSTSFEFTSRRSPSQSRSSDARPVITVSPPRGVKDSEDAGPAAHQPTPSVSSWRSPRSLRRPMILPFSNKKEDQMKVARSPPSPTMMATPPLPHSMQFPIPPNSQVSTPLAKSSRDDARPRRETMSSGKSVTIISPTSATFSEFSRRTSRAQSQTSRESKDQVEQLSPTSALPSVEELPPPRTPSRLSITTAGHASVVGRPGSLKSPVSATHTRLSFLRGSRTPSPAGTPPTAPLPSLPPEANEKTPPPPPASNQVSASAYPPAAAPSVSRHLDAVPTIPSLYSVSSNRSVTPLRQLVLRPRANTIPTTPTFVASSVPSPTLVSIPETGKLNLKDTEKKMLSAEHPQGFSCSTSKEREAAEASIRRGSVSTTASTATSPPTEISTPPRKVTDSPLYGDVMSLRATHEEYVQSIRETHAMEKAELQRRIEQLEREARKRDREIKGLRWLVMNANNGAGIATGLGGPNAKSAVSLSTAETQGRYRSGSKSSEFSQLSTSSSGINIHRRDATESTPALTLFQSPRTSTEEGLLELQTTIADLIAPALATPSLSESLRTKAQSPIPLASPLSRQGGAGSASVGTVATRLRRANTLPDALSPLPTVTQASPSYTSKSARRTSSPVLPPNSPPLLSSRRPVPTASGAGLGIHNIDIPSIPTSSSSLSYNRLSTTDTTLSTVSTIPSLTSNVSTASSSALSAIPETHNPPALEPVTRDKQKEERDARRASRALKRLSASSSTASVGAASAAYQHNLQLGQTPSIEQILDHSAEANMDDVLKKLRAFGANGDH